MKCTVCNSEKFTKYYIGGNEIYLCDNCQTVYINEQIDYKFLLFETIKNKFNKLNYPTKIDNIKKHNDDVFEIEYKYDFNNPLVNPHNCIWSDIVIIKDNGLEYKIFFDTDNYNKDFYNYIKNKSIETTFNEKNHCEIFTLQLNMLL